jgi:HK97 family phage major capsid protein
MELQSLAALSGRPTRAFADAGELDRYEADFGKYLRQGKDGVDMHAWVRQDFQVAVDGDGGFLVPPDMSGRIVTRLYETSSLRGLAFVQNTSRSELMGIADTADISFWWAGEAEPDQDATNTTLGEYQIQVEELRTQPKASLRMLSDAAVNVESWLGMKAADRFARAENDAFINGSGSKRPRGLVTYTTNTTADGARSWGVMQHVNTGASGAFKAAASDPADCLIDLVATLKPAYLGNARWLARRATFAAIRRIKATDGQYLWQPSLAAGTPSTIMGYPIVEAEDMPAIAANSLAVAFGDFREGYTIVDREGISILRDPYTSKGYVKFFTRKRVGGGVVNFDAIKFLRFGT